MAKEISISQIPIFPLNLSGLVLFCIDTSDSESGRIFQHFSRSTRLSHLCTAPVLIFALFCTLDSLVFRNEQIFGHASGKLGQNFGQNFGGGQQKFGQHFGHRQFHNKETRFAETMSEMLYEILPSYAEVMPGIMSEILQRFAEIFHHKSSSSNSNSNSKSFWGQNFGQRLAQSLGQNSDNISDKNSDHIWDKYSDKI